MIGGELYVAMYNLNASTVYLLLFVYCDVTLFLLPTRNL